MQEALSAAWRKRSQYDPTRGSVRVWLLAIVADQARKVCRRNRTTVMLPELATADGAADVSIAKLDIGAAIMQLTERQRLAVILYYYLDLSTVDAATVMRCSTGTVKSTLSESRRHLHRLLGGDYA